MAGKEDLAKKHPGSKRSARSSGGPKTKQGKDVARWNATRHGISSPAPVIPGLESHDDWEKHGQGVLESLQPVGHLETVLAERVALLTWRLHRVTRYETDQLAIAQEEVADDYHKMERFTGSKGLLEITHSDDIRYEAKSTKEDIAALERFPSRTDREEIIPGEEASSILWTATSLIRKRFGMDVEDLDLPGVPEDALITELPEMRVGDVWDSLAVMAAAVQTDVWDLLAATTVSARTDAASAQHKLEQMETDTSRMSKKRLLPSEDTLQKVAREAHLSKQLYQALHELEALQARRHGGKAPLARIDVSGL